jgi:hypothetical protein
MRIKIKLRKEEPGFFSYLYKIKKPGSCDQTPQLPELFKN